MIDLIKYIRSLTYTSRSSDFFFFFFLYIWVLRPVKIISLILSQVNIKKGWKWEISKKKHLTTHKQNLACLTYNPS